MNRRAACGPFLAVDQITAARAVVRAGTANRFRSRCTPSGYIRCASSSRRNFMPAPVIGQRAGRRRQPADQGVPAAACAPSVPAIRADLAWRGRFLSTSLYAPRSPYHRGAPAAAGAECGEAAGCVEICVHALPPRPPPRCQWRRTADGHSPALPPAPPTPQPGRGGRRWRRQGGMSS